MRFGENKPTCHSHIRADCSISSSPADVNLLNSSLCCRVFHYYARAIGKHMYCTSSSSHPIHSFWAPACSVPHTHEGPGPGKVFHYESIDCRRQGMRERHVHRRQRECWKYNAVRICPVGNGEECPGCSYKHFTVP